IGVAANVHSIKHKALHGSAGPTSHRSSLKHHDWSSPAGATNRASRTSGHRAGDNEGCMANAGTAAPQNAVARGCRRLRRESPRYARLASLPLCALLFGTLPVGAAPPAHDPIEGKWYGMAGFAQDREPIGFEFRRNAQGTLKAYLYD